MLYYQFTRLFYRVFFTFFYRRLLDCERANWRTGRSVSFGGWRTFSWTRWSVDFLSGAEFRTAGSSGRDGSGGRSAGRLTAWLPKMIKKTTISPHKPRTPGENLTVPFRLAFTLSLSRKPSKGMVRQACVNAVYSLVHIRILTFVKINHDCSSESTWPRTCSDFRFCI